MAREAGTAGASHGQAIQYDPARIIRQAECVRLVRR